MGWLNWAILVVLVVHTSTQPATTYCTSKGTGYTITCPCRYDFRYGREPGTAINCKGLGLKWFPTGFPTNTTLLELSNNQITQVDQHSTFAYPMLEALDLSNNSITLFHAETIYNHENLTLLYLRDNPKLPKLPWLPDSLIDLDISNTGYALSHPADLDLKDGYDVPDTLQYLKIENSGLTAWPTSLPSKLKVLKLGGNKLTAIGDLNDCDFLEDLYLDDNLIETLVGDPDLPPSIKTLSLQRNELTSIQSKYFHILSYLRLMSINNNELVDVSRQAFAGLDLIIKDDYTDITLEFMNNPYLKEVYEETFDPFLWSVQKYESFTIDLTGSGINCECEMRWIPNILNNPNIRLSPTEFNIRGSCYSPPALAGRQLSSLLPSEVECPDPTMTPDPDVLDDSANGWAIFLGLMLAISVIGIIGFFVYTKLILGAQAANTYENIPDANTQPAKVVNMSGLKQEEAATGGYQQ